MKNKSALYRILVVVVMTISLVIAGWYLLTQKKDLGIDDLRNLANMQSSEIQYFNSRYGYSLKFPTSWFMDFVGENKEAALGVTFVSDQRDLESGDGGPPVGAKVEIFIHDLKELAENDPDFPRIKTIDEWLAWHRVYWQSFDTESLGKPVDEKITVSRQDAVKSIFENPLYPEDMGKSINIEFLDPSGQYIFVLHYLAQEPSYQENLHKFENIVKSFSFN